MRLLQDRRGDSLTTWIVLIALVVVVAGVTIWGVATSASAQGDNVGSWIQSLNVPSST